MGTAGITAGLILTSFSGEFGGNHKPVYWQLLLSQGVFTGLGMGFLMVPSVTIVSSYFNQRRCLAISLTTLGSSIGGVLYPILFRKMLVTLGFHWAMRTLALIVFATMAAAVMAMKQRMDILDLRSNRTDEIERKSANILTIVKEITWGDWPYVIYCSGMFWTCMGLYSPFFFIEAFSVKSTIDFHGLQSIYLVSIMNTGGIMGRILPGLLADV